VLIPYRHPALSLISVTGAYPFTFNLLDLILRLSSQPEMKLKALHMMRLVTSPCKLCTESLQPSSMSLAFIPFAGALVRCSKALRTGFDGVEGKFHLACDEMLQIVVRALVLATKWFALYKCLEAGLVGSREQQNDAGVVGERLLSVRWALLTSLLGLVEAHVALGLRGPEVLPAESLAEFLKAVQEFNLQRYKP
jgi:hypothetical protein